MKKLEELGIGRPSTYASIMQVLQDRDYVRLDKKRFIPEDRGRIVTTFLENYLQATTSNMISPPNWKKSSTIFPAAKWRGKKS